MEKSKNINGYYGEFASRMRRLMKENNGQKTTQHQLAKSIGVTRQTISKYMDGSMFPNVEKLYDIAIFFGVSSDYLLGNTDVLKPSTDLISTCDFTGLSEELVEYLNNQKNTEKSRKAEIINIMFMNNFIQDVIELIESEVCQLAIEQRILDGQDNTDISELDIIGRRKDKIYEIKRKITDECNLKLDKVLNNVFNNIYSKGLDFIDINIFEKMVKRSILEDFICKKLFEYKGMLSNCFTQLANLPEEFSSALWKKLYKKKENNINAPEKE